MKVPNTFRTESASRDSDQMSLPLKINHQTSRVKAKDKVKVKEASEKEKKTYRRKLDEKLS